VEPIALFVPFQTASRGPPATFLNVSHTTPLESVVLTGTSVAAMVGSRFKSVKTQPRASGLNGRAQGYVVESEGLVSGIPKFLIKQQWNQGTKLRPEKTIKGHPIITHLRL